jgi:hypothetical protein
MIKDPTWPLGMPSDGEHIDQLKQTERPFL